MIMNFNVTPSEASVAGCRITATPISKNLKWLSDPYDDATVQTLTGTQYILTAHPAPGWKFKEYSGSREEHISGDGITPYTRTTYFHTSDNPTIDYADREPGNGNTASSAQMFVGTGVSTLRKIDGSGETFTIRCYSEDYGTVDALFEAADDITISVLASPSDGGSTTGGGLYRPGSSVTLTATSNSGYVFLNWTKDGKVVSNNSTYSFIASEDARYVAVFEEASRKYTIKTSADPVVGGITSGDGRYSRGEPVTIRAVANPGYKFHVWKKGVLVVAGGSGIYAFSATEDAEYVAVFKPCGIIYDPSSGKIMYDANAGSILCYA